MTVNGGGTGMESTRGVPDTRARLGFALLAYMLAVTFIVTLLPFRFAWPVEWRVLVFGPPLDILANVLLFVPLGFLFRFARPRALRLTVLSAVAAGALVSTAIEAVQFFEATRSSSLADVAANALGAGVGALAFERIAGLPRVGGRLIGWLALELPLMGLVYLLVPLLWIASLASQGETARVLTTLVMGVFGAILLGGMQRAYFGPARAAAPRDTAVFTALWFVAGAFPLLAWRPFEMLAGAGAVALLCAWQGARPLPAGAANRRFEVPLLMRAAPVYGVHLALITLLPLRTHLGSWHLSLGFAPVTAHQIEILRVLEIVAAFTLVGYMVAEVRGRAVTHYRDALPRLALWSIALTLVVEGVRGYDAGQGASVARGALTVAAALYGGWLYYLQRAHVMSLLSEATRREPTGGTPG